jgi:hypothetical protein
VAKYRKKPIVVDAVQWFPPEGFIGSTTTPEGVRYTAVYENGTNNLLTDANINTRQRTVQVFPGDYIITAPDGERYPCNPDVFAATYEAAGGDSAEEYALGALDPDTPEARLADAQRMIDDAVRIRDLTDRVRELEDGLEESVKLQSHYAGLLNAYDGGQRIQFSTGAAQWLERLRSIRGR